MAKKPLIDRLLTDDPAARAADRQEAKQKFIRDHANSLEAVPSELNTLIERLRPGQGEAFNTTQIIDHLLFRKLFAETFADGTVCGVRAQGGSDFIVTMKGVRKRNRQTNKEETEEGFQSELGHLFGTSDPEYIAQFEDIRSSTLDFPCSTDDALAWALLHRDTGALGDGPNGVIYVPDWLISALEAEDVDAAMLVLARAGLSVYAKLATAQSEGDHEEQAASRSELRNLQQAMEAFGAIKVAAIARATQATPSDTMQFGSAPPTDIMDRSGLKPPGRLLAAAMEGLGVSLDRVTKEAVANWLWDAFQTDDRKTLGLSLVRGELAYFDARKGEVVITSKTIQDAIRNAKIRAKRRVEVRNVRSGA